MKILMRPQIGCGTTTTTTNTNIYIYIFNQMTHSYNMNENDLLLRAKEERDEIFERYDKGRDSNNIIDSLDETKFENYQRADR